MLIINNYLGNFVLDDELVLEIGKFSILWNTFERNYFDMNCSSTKIREKSGKNGLKIDFELQRSLRNALIKQKFSESIAQIDVEIILFSDKSHTERDVNDVFNFLKDENDSVCGCLLCVQRIRNNLMHGLKDPRELNKQIEIFKAANSILENVHYSTNNRDSSLAITLQPIKEDNYHDVFHLKLAEGQAEFVSHPICSLAQAYIYHDQCTPFGIYYDDRMVGYVMVLYDNDDHEYNIRHMIIDYAEQRNGYGKAAMKKVLEYINTKPFGKSNRVTLTCKKENDASLQLFESIGFTPTDNEDEDKIEMAMDL